MKEAVQEVIKMLTHCHMHGVKATEKEVMEESKLILSKALHEANLTDKIRSIVKEEFSKQFD